MPTRSDAGNAKARIVTRMLGPITKEEIANRAKEAAEAAKLVGFQKMQILRASTEEFQASLRPVVEELESRLEESKAELAAARVELETLSTTVTKLRRESIA